MDASSKADFVYTAIINGSQADVWDAITNPDQTVQYFFGTRVESDWHTGSSLTYRYPDGDLVSTGEIIAIDEPNRLEIMFHAKWDPELEAEGPVREIWTVTPMDQVVGLTIELYDSPAGSKTLENFSTGFPFIASGLKTLIETGAPLM